LFQSVDTSSLVSNVLVPWAIRIAVAILILVAGWILTRIIVKLLTRRLVRHQVDDILVRFIASVTNIVLLLIAVIAALGSLGINTTSLVALIGAAGIAVGVALQDSLKNFAAGVMLIVFRPFRIGDEIEAAGIQGIVEEITTFDTILRTLDNREIIVPNGAIYQGNIINYSARPTRRVDMIFGIGYDEDIRKAREIIQGMLEADKRVLKEPEAVIAISELADSSVNFAVRPWVKTEDYVTVKFDLTERIKLAFDENGISIPYPQMDVHLHGDDNSGARRT
jgi:small conductance mechanosensitive channel